jgi:hemerythrin
MAFAWSNSLKVGVEEIDEQHQELIRRAERLIFSLKGGDRAEVDPIILYLTDYVTSHFECEERWMEKALYPALQAHRDAHRRFREELAEMTQEYRRKGPTPLMALVVHNWLVEWLRGHIGGADVEMASWLKTHGIGLSRS